jgi:hypothetical protein
MSHIDLRGKPGCVSCVHSYDTTIKEPLVYVCVQFRRLRFKICSFGFSASP